MLPLTVFCEPVDAVDADESVRTFSGGPLRIVFIDGAIDGWSSSVIGETRFASTLELAAP
jgi:hypothetical protein